MSTNNDGYALFTGVDTPESCRDRCNSEANKCGAYEFENYDLDNRECELHERSIISYQNTVEQGGCQLSMEGAYRCCWILKEIVNGVTNKLGEEDESAFNTTESYLTGEEFNKSDSTVSDSSNTSSLSASLAEKCYIANFALLIRSLSYSF